MFEKVLRSTVPTYTRYFCNIYTNAITRKAYVQSGENLSRDVYLETPEEMNLDNQFVLKAAKPLYGIPESGLHWYKHATVIM